MSKSVLLVEDEKVLRDVYTIVMRSEGYEVHTANNGLDGLQKLNSLHPDVVLLDLFMPVMDGKEFMRNVIINDFPNTKIIVYSNLSDRKTEAEMLSLGVNEFILKSSMTPKDLLALLDKTIYS